MVDDQMGCELMQVDNQALKCLLPYMSKFMKLLTFALKIGVHLAAGMGEMIPDLSREVAHLIDSSFLYGTAAIAAGAVGGAAALGRARGTQSRGSLNPESSINSRNISQDIKAAQQWLVDFLKDQKIATGKDIAQRFGLWRVRYTDTGHIAWICRRHKEARGIQVVEVPI